MFPPVKQTALWHKLSDGITLLSERLAIYKNIPKMPRFIWTRIVMEVVYSESISLDDENIGSYDVFILAYVNKLIRAPGPPCFSTPTSTLSRRTIQFFLNNLLIWLENGGVWPRDVAAVIQSAKARNQLTLAHIARVLHTAPDRDAVVRVINNLLV